MDQFFTDTWPQLIGAIMALSAAARLIISKFPQAAKYLRYVAVIVDVFLFAGKAIKNARQETKGDDTTGKRSVHSEENSPLEGAPKDRSRTKDTD